MIYDADPSPPAHVTVTIATLEHLRNTRPWVRLIAVLGFIECGLIGVLGLVFFVFSAGMSALAGKAGSMPTWILGPIYLFIAALYLFLSLYLWRYANALRDLEAAPSSQPLEEAMKQQAKFWRFVGILAVAGLVLMALAIVGMIFAVLIGVVAASK